MVACRYFALRSGVAAALLCGACAPEAEPRLPTFHCPPQVDEKTADVHDLCATLEPVRQKFNLPSIAAALWTGDVMIAQGAAGVRKVGTSVPVTTKDRWHLGSGTKPMTATLAAILVAEGELSFDETIPSLFSGERVHPGYEGVTLRLLLSHRAGVRRDFEEKVWSKLLRDARSFEARQWAVPRALNEGPQSPVGVFSYSNVGYVIAGAALERRTGLEWEELMRRRIFRPLGMLSCGFGSPARPESTDQPWGHRVSDGQFHERAGPSADNPPSLGPAGTVHCSLEDWGKFLAEHRKAARQEQTLLPAQAMRELHVMPDAEAYAHGWVTESPPWLGEPALSHSGTNGANYSDGWVLAESDLMVTIAMNVGGKRATDATREVLQLLLR